ncbi:MAG: putative DNA binding domain-containing protein [Deltaproteobacteria bacterium]|nr:putative DNA binding domain-containing protein [Deltaproteobacteria bacterium]MBW2330419.1 putative DNA binding domain-containing protein [Deltaproteobacteria bacterium]
MDIFEILKKGESETVEFKERFNKETIISLVAFANTKGGKIIVGADRKGRVTGIKAGRETAQRYLNEIKVATYPQILPNVDEYEIQGKTVLVFEIKEYPVKPICFKNRYYKRVKNSNHLLTLDEIVDLQQQSLNISYDAYPLKENLSSLDTALLEKFVETINSRGRINLQDDLLTNLTKLKLIQAGKPTLAGMLLFGNHGFSIHIGRFKSEDTIIDDLLIKDPLLVALDEAMIFIKKHISLSYRFDGSLKRKESWQYPLEAIRELLLNSVVHRDYKHSSDIVIKVFDDRIVFTNPGRIYGNLTIKDLERDDYVSSIRNKLLAESFYLMGDIEKYGTGFIRIRKLIEDYPGVSYSISETGDFFKVEMRHTPTKPLLIPKTDLPEKLPENLPEKLPVIQRQIIENMLKNPKITYNELADITGKTRETIRVHINKLKEMNLIKRIGPDKGGYWEILGPQSTKHTKE